MSDEFISKAPPAELTAGAGYSYERNVVAYYLAALLCHETAIGGEGGGMVTRVAVQQQANGRPLDDLCVQFTGPNGEIQKMDVQIKQTVKATPGDPEFCRIIRDSLTTQGRADFNPKADACGFITSHISDHHLRNLNRLIERAKHHPDSPEAFGRYIDAEANQDVKRLREALRPVIGAQTTEEEVGFYSRFIALQLKLNVTDDAHAQLINRLQALTAEGQGVLLFDTLRAIAGEGGAQRAEWTRNALLAQLQKKIRLNVPINDQDDVNLLNAASLEAMGDISTEIDGVTIHRPLLLDAIDARLEHHRLVILTGLPGCGKSAALRSHAERSASSGPVLFLKSDRMNAMGWTAFAASLGVKRTDAACLLAVVAVTGTPVLYIDGMDAAAQHTPITDLLRVIARDPDLAAWKAVITVRRQELERVKPQLPKEYAPFAELSMEGAFTDSEADQLAQEKPHLRRLLFNSHEAAREIARRPFFAAVLARQHTQEHEPHSELDLLNSWWDGAGYNTPRETVIIRQQALLDLAEKGARHLGQPIPLKDLQPETKNHISALEKDGVLIMQKRNLFVSFSHDLFFEWTYVFYMISAGDAWPARLEQAGMPPLLGRAVHLLAQETFKEDKEAWRRNLARLTDKNPPSPWLREWLTAPPFTAAFGENTAIFAEALQENNVALLENLLRWFPARHGKTPSDKQYNAWESQKLLLRSYNIIVPDRLIPDDPSAWAHLITLLLNIGPAVPVHLIPHIVPIFEIWLNDETLLHHPVSNGVLQQCRQWLEELGAFLYPSSPQHSQGRWSDLPSKTQDVLFGSLTANIFRTANQHPAYIAALLERAATHPKMLRDVELMLVCFVEVLAESAPESLARAIEARVIRPLTRDLRQEMQQRKRFCIWRYASSGYGLADDISIDWFQYELFKKLLFCRPDIALPLIKKITNHAATAVCLSYRLSGRPDGRPIQAELHFPWGTQTYFFDMEPDCFIPDKDKHPVLGNIYHALRYYAFMELEKGRAAGDLIKEILQGSKWTALTELCLHLALETLEVSETTLPLVTCQNLWNANKFLHCREYKSKQLSTYIAKEDFLKEISCRQKILYLLASQFFRTTETDLRIKFIRAITDFPNNLPYCFESEIKDPARTDELRNLAIQWASFGDDNNYSYHINEGKRYILYTPPHEQSDESKQKLADISNKVKETTTISRIIDSYHPTNKKPLKLESLSEDVRYAKAQDLGNRFNLNDNGSDDYFLVCLGVTAAASGLIRFGDPNDPDREWAWSVMHRIKEHRTNKIHLPITDLLLHLVCTLRHDRQSAAPCADRLKDLIELTDHQDDNIRTEAFRALFEDPAPRVRMAALHLAVDMAHVVKESVGYEKYGDVITADKTARQAAIANALHIAETGMTPALAPIAPDWLGECFQEDGTETERYFYPERAATYFQCFNPAEWLQQAETRSKSLFIIFLLLRFCAKVPFISGPFYARRLSERC